MSFLYLVSCLSSVSQQPFVSLPIFCFCFHWHFSLVFETGFHYLYHARQALCTCLVHTQPHFILLSTYSPFSFFPSFFFKCVWVVYLYVSRMCLVPREVRRGCQILEYRQLWSTMWVLGMEAKCSKWLSHPSNPYCLLF